jgi:hypothetical protein
LTCQRNDVGFRQAQHDSWQLKLLTTEYLKLVTLRTL